MNFFKIEIRFQNWSSFSKLKFVFKIEIRFQNRNSFSKSKFDPWSKLFYHSRFFSKGEFLTMSEFSKNENMITEFNWGFRIWLLTYLLSFTWGDLTSTFCEWDLCRSKGRKEKKGKTEKFFLSIYFTLENELEWHLHGCKSKTKFETLYSFRDIVFILRHCIFFETLYQCWDIVLISRHCINFETLYLFRDIVLILKHCINFETLY